ncbi:MAG: molecular chaperone TorD family protein [Coriobacteriales bacterium]|jgi:TorA maturation chaperone TorD|nr:molecular chaperone TorD family protein [Coriobacteriales bacterium]
MGATVCQHGVTAPDCAFDTNASICTVNAIDEACAVGSSDSLALAARAGVWRILQRIFGELPDDSLLAELACGAAEEVLVVFTGISDEYDVASSALKDAAVRHLAAGTEGVNQLRDGYTRMFIGPGKVEAPIWESVYRGNDNALFQPITLEVRQQYATAGFLPAAYPRIADDHLALELDFLRALAEQAGAAAYAGDQQLYAVSLTASLEFEQEHLAVWSADFALNVRAAKHGSFYREATDLLNAWLPLDYALLAELRTHTLS